MYHRSCMPGQAKDDSSLISPEWLVASAALFIRTTQCTINFGQNATLTRNLVLITFQSHISSFTTNTNDRSSALVRPVFVYIYIKTQPTLQKAPRHLSFVTKTERHGPKVSKKNKFREKKTKVWIAAHGVNGMHSRFSPNDGR